MKFTVENVPYYNKRYYRLLDESTIRRVAQGHDDSGYAIISASRGENRHRNHGINDELLKNPNEINDIRTEQIRELIYDYGYTYIPVFGRYEENTDKGKIASLEKSFIIYPYKRNSELVPWDDFVKDIYEISNSQDYDGTYIFEQDSILLKAPDSAPVYVNPKTHQVDFNPGDKLIYNDTDQTYFSALKKWKDLSLNRKNHTWDKGEPKRFTFTEALLYQYPNTSNGCHKKQHFGELF